MGSFVYTGQENLEAMKEATNYNRYLTSLIEEQIIEIPKKTPAILDFGAGIGTYADLLLDKGYRADCLELDTDQIKLLRSKDYTVIEGLDRAKKKYDIIYAFNVFEHIEQDIDVFAELSKLLATGGLIIIYVPAFQVLYSAMDRLVEHHRRYSLARLQMMASTADLRVRYLGYGEPIGFLAALVYKRFGNKNGTITPASVKFYDRVAFPISRAISPLFKRLFGKNALLIAKKEK